MEEKTTSVRRELLRSLIDRYAMKGKKVLIAKAKDMGIYKGFQSDEEVYSLIEKFAEFHNLPLVDEDTVLSDSVIPDEKPVIEEKIQQDYFYSVLKKKHDLLSKQLLYLNKLMATYESNP